MKYIIFYSLHIIICWIFLGPLFHATAVKMVFIKTNEKALCVWFSFLFIRLFLYCLCFFCFFFLYIYNCVYTISIYNFFFLYIQFLYIYCVLCKSKIWVPPRCCKCKLLHILMKIIGQICQGEFFMHMSVRVTLKKCEAAFWFLLCLLEGD